MSESWNRVVQQLHDLSTYVALLRSHELPTRIASVLDSRPPNQLSTEPDDKELRTVIVILVQMIENKWGFGSVSTNHQRMLDYAHDWASETLLSLSQLPSLELEVTEQTTVNSAALDEMQRSLFVLRPHTMHDRLASAESALQDAISGHDKVTMDSEAVAALLEKVATSVHEDARFVDYVEQVVAAQHVDVVGTDCMKRLLRQQKAETTATSDRLFDALSLHARATLWASDMAFWHRQASGNLDDWLVKVHEAPFRAVAAILRVGEESRVVCPSYLHVTMISWATQPSRRRWMRATRSRALLCAVSKLLRDPDADDEAAYGRKVLVKVPQVLWQKKSSHWTPQQRAYVLQCVAHNLLLLTQDKHHQWLEFTGLIERDEVLQCAIDTLMSCTKDSASKDWTDAVAILTWHESVVHDATNETESEIIKTAIYETAQGLDNASDWQAAVAWLQLHRSSSFASCTLTRLRLTWRWLVQACTTETAAPLNDALESVEYAFRRFAPTKDTRRFQIEVMSMFIKDLEWCYRDSRPKATSLSTEAKEALEIVTAWLRKLVRLLPTDAAAVQSQPSLSHQLEERLEAFTALYACGR